MRSAGSRLAAAAVWLMVAIIAPNVSTGWGAGAPEDLAAGGAASSGTPPGFVPIPALPPAGIPGGYRAVPAGKPSLVHAEDLAASVTLNQAVFDIGEPIMATLTIRNTSAGSIVIDGDSDYRAWSHPRFRIRVSDEKGVAIADPLKGFLNWGAGSRLDGGGVTIAPGESRSISTLLNLYAEPRLSGRYTVTGDYPVAIPEGNPAAIKVEWPAVTFEVRDRASHLSLDQGKALLAQHNLADLHPCILYGLQDDTSRIPELLTMVLAPRPEPVAGAPTPTLAEQNAAYYAMEALVLIADKEAVYGALEAEIAKRYPEPHEEGQALYDPLAQLYRTAVTPEVLPLLEKSMENRNRSVADLEFCTALSLGGLRALERLPEALRSDNEALRDSAMQGANLFLMRAYGPPELQMDGLSTEPAAAYDDALLEGFRQEERRDPTDPARPDAWVSRYIMNFHFQSHHLWDAIQIAVQSDSELKHRAVLNYLVNYGRGLSSPSPWNPALDPRLADPRNLASLIPFARRQMAKSADPVTRAHATRYLGLWGDADSVPALAAALDGADPQQRMAAAQALILLHREPLLEKSIGRLVDDDGDMRPTQVIWLARRLGMKDYASLEMVEGGKGVPRANRNPSLPGEEEPLPGTIEEMRHYRKAVLRRLAGAASQATAAQATEATSEKTGNQERPTTTTERTKE